MKYYPHKTNFKIPNDILNELESIRKVRGFNPEKYIQDKIKIIQEYYKNNNLDGAIVAISGGIDSAVVAALMVLALGKDNVIGITLPQYDTGMSNLQGSLERAKNLMKTLNLQYNEIDVSHVTKNIISAFKEIKMEGDGWAEGQLTAYARTPILYYATSIMSSKNKKYIIAGTTNMSEGAYLGYVGKASDGMVDIQVISDIHKSEVISVAKSLSIPKNIINTTPSGDMYDGRSDEEVFGAPYDFLELYLHFLTYTQEQKNKLLSRLSLDSRTIFSLYQNNLDKLHNFNKHKYKVGSPAYPLDIKELIFYKKTKFGWGIFNYE